MNRKLGLIALVSLLVGCGGGNDPVANPASAPEDAFMAFTKAMVTTVDEDQEPVNVQEVEVTEPENAEAIDWS